MHDDHDTDAAPEQDSDPTTTVKTEVDVPTADPNRSDHAEDLANEASHKARDENAAR